MVLTFEYATNEITAVHDTIGEQPVTGDSPEHYHQHILPDVGETTAANRHYPPNKAAEQNGTTSILHCKSSFVSRHFQISFSATDSIWIEQSFKF